MRLEWRNDPQMNGMILWKGEYSDGMTEWSRIREISELRVLPLFKNPPSFDLIRSFQNDWNEVEMTRMTVEWYLPIVIFILCYSKMIWNEGMRWNEGVFGEGEKNEFWDVCHSAIIPSSFRNSNTNLALDCPWNDLNDTGMTEMSREWQNDNGMMGGLMLSRGKGVWGSRPEAEVIVEPQTPFPRDSINPLPREMQKIFWHGTKGGLG